MNELCREIEEDLPLYAEGELADGIRRARVRLHLGLCEECRGRVRAHDELTRRILGGGSLPAALGSLPAALGSLPAALGFADRVMERVRRRDRARRSARLGRRRLLRAAAILVFAGLTVSLAVRFADRGGGSARSPYDLALREERSTEDSPGIVAGDRSAGEPRDLRDSWWVIGPEGEGEDPARAAGERLIYTRAGAAGRDDGSRPLPRRNYLRLKGLLLLGAQGRSSARQGYQLLMVPERRDLGESIPLRPVAMPVEVDEGEIHPAARHRLESPRVRYRIIWRETSVILEDLAPAPLPPPSGDGAVPFPAPARDRLPLQSLPLEPERS